MSPTKTYVVKIILVAVCLALFVAQSYRELAKYATGLTSTAIYTENDDDPGYPTIVFCGVDAYKQADFIDTIEKYEENTQSYEDIFAENTTGNGCHFTVRPISTLFNGKCFLVDFEMAYCDENVWWRNIRVNEPSNVTINLIARHQEICIILGDCSEEYIRINPFDGTTAISVTAGKRIWPARYVQVLSNIDVYMLYRNVYFLFLGTDHVTPIHTTVNTSAWPIIYTKLWRRTTLAV
jgi:hypothetical protein